MSELTSPADETEAPLDDLKSLFVKVDPLFALIKTFKKIILDVKN